MKPSVSRLGGRPAVFDLTLSVQPGYEQSLSRVLVSFIDITERKRAEEALRERNRYIETILENSPIGFAVNTIHDGKGVFVSQQVRGHIRSAARQPEHG